MILMPCAPRRIAFCIARFIARRNMIRFSSCCAIESAIELRVDLGLADLLDVEADVAAHHLAQLGAQRLDVLALLADDDARAARCGS